MSHRFRFSGSCLDRLKEYGKGAAASPKAKGRTTPGAEAPSSAATAVQAAAAQEDGLVHGASADGTPFAGTNAAPKPLHPVGVPAVASNGTAEPITAASAGKAADASAEKAMSVKASAGGKQAESAPPTKEAASKAEAPVKQDKPAPPVKEAASKAEAPVKQDKPAPPTKEAASKADAPVKPDKPAPPAKEAASKVDAPVKPDTSAHTDAPPLVITPAADNVPRKRHGLFGWKKPRRTEEPLTVDALPSNGQQHTTGGTHMVVWTRTDIGKVRRTNQDAVIDAEPLVGVADGMGGHNGGEVASAGARDGLVGLLKGKTPDADLLRTAITAVNRRLYLRQMDDPALSGMGTTLTVLWVGEESIYVGHVGDSRAYRLRDGALTQMTQDHSVVAEMVREGLLTKEQAACHPMRNVITRAVGTEEGIEVDVLTEPRHEGDLWLVCSDGLYGMMTDEDMRRILTENPPDKAADLLVQAALAAGGRDNVSLAILRDGEAAQ